MARGGRAVCTGFRVLSSQSKPTCELLCNLLSQPDCPPSLPSWTAGDEPGHRVHLYLPS